MQYVRIENYMKDSKLWVQKLPPKEILYNFLREGAFTPLISQILINKGFQEVSSAYTFLFPQITDFANPFDVPEMSLAVQRIAQALKNKEIIGIYGDSDADGIIGSYVLFDFIREVSGKEPVVIIPDKNLEGYGFHGKYLSFFKEKGVSLVITVDVGISATETVNAAKAFGLDVIITDHHEVLRKPDCIVVSGKFTPSHSPFYHLCGAGVVFTLLRALRSYLYEEGFFSQCPPPQLRKYLELVTLATLADMVPLWGENRLITYFGFRDLREPTHPSLKALFDHLNFRFPISEEDLHFKVIPRINACGRMGRPELFFEFLKAGRTGNLDLYLQGLQELHEERQTLELSLWETLEKNLSEEKDSPIYIGIFENIPKGILGLLANRVKNKIGKPALIISFDNGVGFGSGRAPEEINLLEALLPCKDLFLELGGHKRAFGFQITRENLPRLKGYLKELNLSFESLDYQYVDGETRISELLFEDNLLAFQALPPYGMSHEPPLLLVKDFEVKEVIILKEKHTKYLLRDGLKELYALYFNQIADEKVKLIVGTPFINNFSQRLEIRVEDAKS